MIGVAADGGHVVALDGHQDPARRRADAAVARDLLRTVECSGHDGTSATEGS